MVAVVPRTLGETSKLMARNGRPGLGVMVSEI
jgi:hypothetical protein